MLFLGLDVGSLSCDAVLLGADGELLQPAGAAIAVVG